MLEHVRIKYSPELDFPVQWTWKLSNINLTNIIVAHSNHPDTVEDSTRPSDEKSQDMMENST
jgi:hypothetical protein